MGVIIREKPPGSGDYYIFINWQGYRKSKKIGRDERLADEVAEKVKAKLVLGENPFEAEIANQLPTFEQYARKWLALPTDCKQTTLDVYERMLRLHILPKIGSMRLDKITKPRVQELCDAMAVEKYGKATVKLVKVPIGLIFEHAIDGGLVAENPVGKLKVKGRPALPGNDPLDHDAAERFLEHVKHCPDGEYYPLFFYALRTGKRIGEILATKWKDIDFKQRFVRVKRNLVRGHFYSTKNSKERSVGLSPKTIEVLKALRTAQKRKALKGGYPVPEFVFTDDAGQIRRQPKIRAALERCLKSAGMKRVTPHDFRHSYAKIRLGRGHNIADVSRSLGHSDIKITVSTYGHMERKDFMDEIDSLDSSPHAGAPQPQTTQEKS